MNLTAQFCLYVASLQHHSSSSDILHLKRFLTESLSIRFELEIVDVLKDPARAVRDGVLATPTLVRVAPPPPARIIGDYTDRIRVLAALELGS